MTIHGCWTERIIIFLNYDVLTIIIRCTNYDYWYWDSIGLINMFYRVLTVIIRCTKFNYWYWYRIGLINLFYRIQKSLRQRQENLWNILFEMNRFANYKKLSCRWRFLTNRAIWQASINMQICWINVSIRNTCPILSLIALKYWFNNKVLNNAWYTIS